MKINLEEGHIWYDASLWERDSEALKIGDMATVRTSGFHSEFGKLFPATEFWVTPKEEMLLELTGVVKSIKMVVSNPNTAENNKNIVTEDLNTPGDISGYYVTMKDIRIQTLADSDRETFKIKIDNFEVGWLYITLQFGGLAIPFSASYLGEMPLYTLLDAVEALERGEHNNKYWYHTVWQDEPGCLKMAFVRYMKSDNLSLELQTNTSDVDEHMDPYDGVFRHWSLSFPYQQFRQEVVRTTLYCLKKYGLQGMTVNWNDEGVDFPFLQLINLLDAKHGDIDGNGECKTDIFQELKLVTDALNAIVIEK